MTALIKSALIIGLIMILPTFEICTGGKWVGRSINCLVTDILQNVLLSLPLTHVYELS